MTLGKFCLDIIEQFDLHLLQLDAASTLGIDKYCNGK